MIENSISVFEAVFHKDPHKLPAEISNLLDKTLSKNELNRLLQDNDLKISKEWVPVCEEEISKEIFQDYGCYRLRISNQNNDDIADIGVMNGNDEDLMNLLTDLAVHEVPVYGSSELERNF